MKLNCKVYLTYKNHLLYNKNIKLLCMEDIMSKHINLILMGLYTVTLIIGLIYNASILTNVSTALAVFTFLFVQIQDVNKPLDEREKLIIERASSISFQIVLALLVVFSVVTDFFDILEFITLPNFLSILMGLGFMTFVSMYEYYKQKY